MRIAINMVSLHTGGGNRIAKNLLLSLEKHPEHDYLIFIPKQTGFEYILERSDIHYTVYFKAHRKTSFWGRLWFDNVTIPRKIAQFKADILISLTNISTFFPKIPHIVLFHHPHFVYPESPYYHMIGLGERIRKELEKICFRFTLKGSAATVVQTPVSGERLLKYYSRFITRDRIHIIPHSAIPITPEPAKKFDYSYDRDTLYIFSPTRYYPHKNLELLGRIAEELHKRDITGIKFLITLEPSHDSRCERFLKAISTTPINQYFDNLGFIETECLENIYKHIDIVIVQSLLESQSFSYLEALYFQKPIITTDMDFAHIVCGKAARYFSPEHPGEWADFLIQIKNNPAMLETMSKESHTRAKSYLISSDDVCQAYLDLAQKSVAN